MSPENHPTISLDPDMMSGRACVRGTRLTVAAVLHMLRHHEGSIARVLDDYPGLTREDVLACIGYGAALASADKVESPKRK